MVAANVCAFEREIVKSHYFTTDRTRYLVGTATIMVMQSINEYVVVPRILITYVHDRVVCAVTQNESIR